MLVQEWMTKEVVTITADISIMKAARLMKDKRVGRLPVVDEDGRIVGILTDRDIRSASPSKATTLEMHELYYLLSELKTKDVMNKNPICARETDSVEGIARLMMAKRIGGVPVVDDAKRVVGIITDSDIFKVLVDITGADRGGIQLAFEIPATPGSLRPILDGLRALNAGVISVLTSQKGNSPETRRVYIRLRPLDEAMQAKVVESMKAGFPLLYWEPALKKDADA